MEGQKVDIGIIGGSGIYKIEGVEILEEVLPKTPYGEPSDKIVICQIGKKRVGFLPRHGVGHRLLPTEIPVKANIYALKSLGVKSILAISAVGSLVEEIRPKDLVIPNQIIDRTRQRALSFFGDGIVGHVSFADPFCNEKGEALYTYLDMKGYNAHNKVTYLCMEGPLFSTRAESHLYRSWGCGIIGMTALPEAKLSREAEICYNMIALSTDYDCWNEAEEHVTTEMVIENMNTNVKTIKGLLPDLLKELDLSKDCGCHHAAENSVMTSNDMLNENKRLELNILYGKYFNKR